MKKTRKKSRSFRLRYRRKQFADLSCAPSIIESVVCSEFGVTPRQLRQRFRTGLVAEAHHFLVYLLRYDAGLRFRETHERLGTCSGKQYKELIHFGTNLLEDKRKQSLLTQIRSKYPITQKMAARE